MHGFTQIVAIIFAFLPAIEPLKDQTYVYLDHT